MEISIGERVAHYKIVGNLGRGGMGVVYEAEDENLGRRVALKFLSAEIEQDRQSLERLQREARAASSLNHPGICTVFAIENHERHIFLVMELLEGHTLTSAMSHDPLEISRLFDVAIQLADALESAHSRGIVRRDIKPANIFINDRDQIKILDFGLAKIKGAHGLAKRPGIRRTVPAAGRRNGLSAGAWRVSLQPSMRAGEQALGTVRI